ncbi:TPA: LysM peptidoglycan-binding domain-containing protein [Pseudomonas aeruginosa]
MNKANECTCPSGDGSLVHPCPAHPAVEQVGGDERASKPGLFCRDCGSRLMVRGVCSIYCPNCVKAQVKQAEAERPEVVARVVHSNPVVLGQCGPLNANDELMTVAQHAASVARWAEMFNRVEQQRDAALARVAELEACGAPALLAAADYFAERAKGPSPGWVTLSAVAKELRVRADKAPVAQAQQLHDLDKQCRDDVARALGLRPNQERGFAWSYLLASIKSCVKASGDSAQAQHSVPAYVSYTTQPAESLAGIALRQLKDESRWVEIRDINAHAFPDMRSHSYYPAGTVIKLPAAAPGKEVGHE